MLQYWDGTSGNDSINAVSQSNDSTIWRKKGSKGIFYIFSHKLMSNNIKFSVIKY